MNKILPTLPRPGGWYEAMKSAAEVTKAKGESQVRSPNLWQNLLQEYKTKMKSKLGCVAGVPASGVVIVANVVKLPKRPSSSIVLVKVEICHLGSKHNQNEEKPWKIA